MADIQITSTITCPECRAQTRVEMPADRCVFFWECPSCETTLRPAPGDCCVFCTHGFVPCPPVQADDGCCT
ncbi:GDCCVxC domain-containing (seleno)protein [Salinibacter sp.]|jgi:hypothetical protein|uniref:GDCCVxC domain-containing (seleno)protein n=1 Tax=Salinibacter sp. TaxID=2065818 RepID=UPI00234319CE|nr:GDCCVxC domain-containing (seleno)protein [Salinibacter sp.]